MDKKHNIQIGKNQFVDEAQLLYCKADNGYTELYLKGSGKILVSKSLKRVYEELNKSIFIKISQSYLVNKKEIIRLSKKEKKVCLKSGEELSYTLSVRNFIGALCTNDYNQKEMRSSFNQLIISTQTFVYLIDPSEMLYCKARSNYTAIFMKDGSIVSFRKTIKNMLNFLDPEIFLRVSQTYVVSIAQIDYVNIPGKEIKMKNMDTIPFTYQEIVEKIGLKQAEEEKYYKKHAKS